MKGSFSDHYHIVEVMLKVGQSLRQSLAIKLIYCM